MQATMMHYPMTVQMILQRGERIHSSSRVRTFDGESFEEASFASVAARAANLAAALRDLGVQHGECVATLCWNHQAHMEAYLALPSMGAVLHTLNGRLFPEQLAYVINHAMDRVILVDASLLQGLEQALPYLETVRDVIVMGAPDSRLEGVRVHDYGALPEDGTTVGELQLRGPWVTGSYHRDPNPEAFTADGWLRTGDVGAIDAAGYVRITDRVKDVIKSGGEWISSVELEGLLLEHPDVAEAAIVAVADPRWQERPLAVVVPKAGANPTSEALRAHLEGRVARFWLPERWAFVEQLPLTSVGKLDKKALRQWVETDEGATTSERL